MTDRSLKRLTCFMFLLIRDYIRTGEIAKILKDIGDIEGDDVVYDNEYLKALSEDYARRILKE